MSLTGSNSQERGNGPHNDESMGDGRQRTYKRVGHALVLRPHVPIIRFFDEGALKGFDQVMLNLKPPMSQRR